jgi:hypothetical protein
MQAALMDRTKLPALLSEAAQLKVSATVCQKTGCGVALRESWIWETLDGPRLQRKEALVEKWKKRVQQEVSKAREESGRAAFPKNTKKSQLLVSGWTSRLQDMLAYFRSMEGHDDLSQVHCTRLAIRVLLAGFRSVDELAGLPASARDRLTTIPKEMAMLARVIADMDAISATARATKLRKDLGVLEPRTAGPRSAQELASTLTPEELARLHVSNNELQKELNISIDIGPRAATRSMLAAKQRGKGAEVEALLDARVLEMRLQQQRKSLPQVACGLKSWHMFATAILGYQDEAILPPETAHDVCRWLMLFQNAATAGNYLSYLRWSCREFGKSLAWSDPSVASLLKSMRKMDLQTRVASLPEGVRYSETEVQRLTLLAWELRDTEFGILATLSYQYLFRVASECIPLEIGDVGEMAHALPADRHSSIYVHEGRLHVRLRSRKNRPQGSLLIRECCCSATADMRLCPVHCVDWANRQTGVRLFSLSASSARQKLRRFAAMLALPGADRVTLKLFRSSRATNLALAGKPLHAILEAGEWRSAALLRYVSPDVLDAGSLLTQTVIGEAQDEDSD